MVDVKSGEWTQNRLNGTLHLMLRGRTPQINGQDQIVQSGNNCYSSIRVAFIDEMKIVIERLPWLSPKQDLDQIEQFKHLLLAKWVESSPMIRETRVQSQVASYQRLLKWYLIPLCLTLSNIRYVSTVKWSNQGKGVAPPRYISV